MYKDINQKHLFDNVNLGFEFEFFSPLTRAELSEMLTQYLGKKVHWTNQYHSDIPVGEGEFKLEPDFSGGFKMNELVTSIMPYNEAIHTLFKILNFISENGFTSERTGIHINISFNEADLGLREKLQHLNVFKYILNLNEAKIFELWPSAKSRIQKIYKNSVLNIYPKNKFIAEAGLAYSYPASPLDFNLPHAKYFGINFTKLSRNYLEIRYAGGKGYETKKNEAVELINYIAESLYENLLSNSEYSPAESRKISDLLAKHRDILLSVKTYENFVKAYPEIELYVDLRNDPRIVESNYANLKEKLFELITTGNLKKGIVNYDTTKQRIQLKDSNLKESFSVSGIDFVNCTIEGEITNCELFGCKVRSSHVQESTILSGNDIRYSYLRGCTFIREGRNRIDLSFIKNAPGTPIYSDLNECIVRSGTVGLNCRVDSKTEFIEQLIANQTPNK
jgi:Putative amidoligase enzyme